MNEGAKKSGGLKWPICSMLIIAAIGATVYWGYTKFKAEQLMAAGSGPSISVPASPSPGTSSKENTSSQTYRSRLPLFLLVGFAAMMIVILGGILYLWWSLKDWEGGKKYGEEAPPTKEQT